MNKVNNYCINFKRLTDEILTCSVLGYRHHTPGIRTIIQTVNTRCVTRQFKGTVHLFEFTTSGENNLPNFDFRRESCKRETTIIITNSHEKEITNRMWQQIDHQGRSWPNMFPFDWLSQKPINCLSNQECPVHFLVYTS